MGQILDLYRGDATKIDEFNVKKTYKWCLLGRGIYLTDSLRVAESYCNKDADIDKRSYLHLYRGLALNRDDAFLKGFKAYCCQLENYNPAKDGPKLPAKRRSKLEAEMMERYRLARLEGVVEISYDNAAYYANKPKGQRALEVIYHRRQKFGHVSHFKVDKATFNASVINVDEPVRDPDFWRIMYEHKLKVGLQAETESEYIALNIDKRVLCPSDYRRPMELGAKPDYFSMAKVLAPYGIIGLEYCGGTYIGGKGYHRAFCIWDEEYINERKVGFVR